MLVENLEKAVIFVLIISFLSIYTIFGIKFSLFIILTVKVTAF